MIYAIVLVCAYFLGSIPFGFLIARSRGVDVRKEGSGNIGATNVWRVLGKKWGLTTFLCDMAKGLVAVIVARDLAAIFAQDPATLGILAAIGCILGHSFPVWLGFKGGKGVATSLGVIFGMMPVASLIVFALWGAVFKLSRYVSLASIVASFALPMVVVVLLMLNVMQGWAYFYFAVAASLLVVLRHTANIRRLLAGTENRFGKSAS
jgi:glycerol-3-phosphate acyltransferase PlsY